MLSSHGFFRGFFIWSICMSRILIVSLNPCVDKKIYISSWCWENENRVLSSSMCCGGKGINVMRTLLALKRKVSMVGFLAGQQGEYIQQELSKKSVNAQWLFIDGQTRVNETIVDVLKNKNIRFLDKGPCVTAQHQKDFKKIFLKEVLLHNVVIFTGSLPDIKKQSFYAELITIAKEHHLMTVLDTSQKPLLLALKAKPFLIKPNRQEAEAVLGYKLSSKKNIIRALKDLFAFGVRLVLISLGQEGLVGFDGARAFHIQPKDIKKGLTVGCGDATLAGFMHIFLEGKDFLQCLCFATACGSANVNVSTPGNIQQLQLRRVLKRMRIKKII